MASNSYKFTDVAKKDLDETIYYISKELSNPIAARNLFIKIEETISRICAFPNSCPLVENEFVVNKNIRKAVINNYIMYYSFEEDKRTVSILRITYGRRNLEEILRNM